jgi:hypothetical protein
VCRQRDQQIATSDGAGGVCGVDAMPGGGLVPVGTGNPPGKRSVDSFDGLDPTNPRWAPGGSSEWTKKWGESWTRNSTKSELRNGKWITVDENGNEVAPDGGGGPVDGTVTLAKKEFVNEFWGKQAGDTGSFTLGGQDVDYSWNTSAGAFAKVDGDVKIDDGRLIVEGVATVGVLAQSTGSVSTTFGSGDLAVDLESKGTVSVGATATGTVGGEFGLDGVAVKAGGEAFVGGRADGEISGEVAGVKATAGAGVSYGLGVHGDVEAAFGVKKVKLKVDVGATVGLGGQLKIDVEVNPIDLTKKIGKKLWPF